MRAAQAAGDTTELIEGTIKRVGEGSQAVSATSEAFEGVVRLMARIGELVGEIAAASNEQTRGIELLNKAMAEMDKVVQENASAAQESASASEEMNAQAEQMQGFVDALVGLTRGRARADEDIEKGVPSCDDAPESADRIPAFESAPEAVAEPASKAGQRVVVLHAARKFIAHQSRSQAEVIPISRL